MSAVVLDLETKETFEDVGSYNPSLLHLSLVGMYDYASDVYKAFREEELSKLWPYLEKAQFVIGYNIKGFDWPVLKKYYTGDLDKIPLLDMLEKVRKVLGFRIKLDNLAKANLPFSKSGDGLLAVEYYRKGEWDKLEKYCLDDVRVTKAVYDLGLKDKVLSFFDSFHNKKTIPLDFSMPIEKGNGSGMNYTLPF